MDRNCEYQTPYGINFEANPDEMYNPMFNPIMQYEQAYMYYRYLSQQLDYKIKLKEYEKLNGNSRDRKID